MEDQTMIEQMHIEILNFNQLSLVSGEEKNRKSPFERQFSLRLASDATRFLLSAISIACYPTIQEKSNKRMSRWILTHT